MGIIAPERLCKQPSEKLKFQMAFANRLDTSETISSITSITSETTSQATSDLSITESGIEANGTDITLWIASGTADESYRVEIQVLTNAGQEMEGDGILYVRDI